MDNRATTTGAIEIIQAVLVVILALIFLLLSLLHFYWAFGGRVWYDQVLPTSSNGLHRFNPGMVQTLIISFGLLLFAFIIAGNLFWFDSYGRRKYFRYGSLVIAFIFSLRAIGDFKFVGFFKKIKTTRFADNDTDFFSPLCLFIVLLSVSIFTLSAVGAARLKQSKRFIGRE